MTSRSVQCMSSVRCGSGYGR